MKTLIAEHENKKDPALLEFWQSRHPLPFEEMGFDAKSPLHHVFTETSAMGEILSVCVFVPVIHVGEFRGHTCYLASSRRSKALVTFCKETMKQLREHEGFTWIDIETRDDPKLAVIQKLAQRIGFTPVFVPDLGWTDYIWNSKEPITNKAKGELCQQ